MDLNAEDNTHDDEESDLGNDEDDTQDDEIAYTVDQEQGLEPERHPKNEPVSIEQAGKSAENSTGSAVRLRGGAEAELQKEPFKVKFSRGRAAAVYSRDGTDVNTAYTNDIGSSDDPFRPFSSKMEWEIARWAKTRGPSSTSFSELMSIDGVSDE